MKIELKYLLPVVAFYAPGAMMLLGGFVLGYSMDEMREGVAIGGLLIGGTAAAYIVMWLFME